MALSARRHGRGARVSLALQVLAMAALAVAGALLAIQAASWRELRLRADLTAGARNTLDPGTVQVLAGFADDPIAIDVFHRALPEPLTAVSNQVFDRLGEFLAVLESSVPDAVEIRYHDLFDLAGAKARLIELGLEEGLPSVVVSLGERVHVIGLYDEIAEIDWGDSGARGQEPPRLALFRAEEALLDAVAQVADAPRVLFTTGHGEASPTETGRGGVARLAGELDREGFEVGQWDPAQQGPIPEDCDVLAVVAPRRPLGEDVVEAIGAWVRAGGRLLAVTGPEVSEDPGSVDALLAGFGMELERGLIAIEILHPVLGYVEGRPECAVFTVGREGLSQDHPITRPLWERQVRLRFNYTRSFDRGELAGPRATLLDVVASPGNSWRDLPGPDGLPNFALDQPPEELGRFSLVMAAELDAPRDADADPESPAPRARVVGLACAEVFDNLVWETNRDLGRNAFNWLAERESRVRVAPRDPRLSLIEVERGAAIPRFRAIGWWGLSGLCVLLGVVTAWRRRS